MRIAVTGMGIISAIGNNPEENFNSLINYKSGISELENFDTIHQNSMLFAEIKLRNSQLYSILGLDSDRAFSRTALLGMYAAKQTLTNANITELNSRRTGIISSTSVGGMDKTEQFFYDYLTNTQHRKFITCHNAGISTHQIADYLNINGLATTISTACSSGANAIIMGAKLLKSQRLERVIVGGSDALCKFTINGFNSLMIHTNELNTPFDKDRKGLNLGEAAAYLVLESEEVAKQDNRQILAYLSGYGNANDAYHQTASSEDGLGAYLAIEKTLNMAQIEASDVDYINVHGTATPNNDLAESKALIRIFNHQIPPFSSTKPFTGHTLAAAGAIEAVYSILALQNNTMFANLNFKNPIPTTGLTPITTTTQKELKTVLSNSFGFGGNCSALLFSK
ncbi:MAG: beta-ketoacyl-[acyl-carrier-protein] synthase family protein [Bacteroidota bacterium]|nr:beta-ketoacyl-[acyl-carrier-protein] synthase family protein [Bacteroidota bacterium]